MFILWENLGFLDILGQPTWLRARIGKSNIENLLCGELGWFRLAEFTASKELGSINMAEFFASGKHKVAEFSASGELGSIKVAEFSEAGHSIQLKWPIFPLERTWFN